MDETELDEETGELPALSVQPTTPDQQGPLGASAYDRAAELLAAARREGSAVRMGAPSPPIPGQWNGESYLGAQQAAQGALPGVQVPSPAASAQPDYQAQLAELMSRLEQSRTSQEQYVNSAFERSRPSESEKWLAIAAALASPTQHGAFGETMGNVFQALLGYKQGVRGAENTRQQELARLRQAYDLAGIKYSAQALKPRTAQNVWSESLGRFVPKDRVVAVGSGVTADGKPITKYSDGTMGIRGDDGSTAIYDADGSKIGVRARGEAQ